MVALFVSEVCQVLLGDADGKLCLERLHYLLQLPEPLGLQELVDPAHVIVVVLVCRTFKHLVNFVFCYLSLAFKNDAHRCVLFNKKKRKKLAELWFGIACDVHHH